MKILLGLISGGVVLIFLGIALAIGVMINQDIGKASFSTLTSTVVNETVAADNVTAQTLAFTGASINKVLTACTFVINNSDDMTTYASGNYTCGSDGTFTWLNVLDEGTRSVNVTYTQTWENWNNVYNASYQGQMGMASLADWNKTIASVIAAVIIIGLIVSGMGGFMYLRKGGI